MGMRYKVGWREDRRPACPACPAGRMEWRQVPERMVLEWEERIARSLPIEHGFVCAEEGDFWGNASLARLIAHARQVGNPIRYFQCVHCGHMEPLTATDYGAAPR